MHPYIAQKLAGERARDQRRRTAEMQQARAARRERAGARAGGVPSGAGDKLTGTSRHSRRPASAARRLLRRIAAVVAECRYAQRRAAILHASVDQHLLGPAGAPENYREFLLRTSGPLIHEPTAARRLAGQPVR